MLTTLTAGFIALGAVQGPKLASAQLDIGTITSASGQALRLAANQLLAPVAADAVRVLPPAPFEVIHDGELVAVVFQQPLGHGIDYAVEVDVAGERSGQRSTLRYEFSTPSAVVHYLDRRDPLDEIVRIDLSGSDREVVHRAERIQDFALAGELLAVVRLSAERESTIELSSPASAAVQTLRLPHPGIVRDFAAADAGTRLGFSFTSTVASGVGEHFATLMTVDLTGPGLVEPVLGIDGEPITTLGWAFVPGGERMLVLTADSSLVLVDPGQPGAIQPLGQFAEILAISPGGSHATVTDAVGTLAVDLSTGQQQRLRASPLNGQEPFLGLAQLLPSGEFVAKLALLAEDGGRFLSVVAHDDGTVSREVYRTPLPTGSIESFELSPNSQYLAIETVPDFSSATIDGYDADARYRSTTTVFVELSTGSVVRSVEGFSVSW